MSVKISERDLRNIVRYCQALMFHPRNTCLNYRYIISKYELEPKKHAEFNTKYEG